MYRRSILSAVAAHLICGTGQARASQDSFDALFATAESSPALIEGTHVVREGLKLTSESAKGPLPRIKPSSRAIDSKAVKMVVLFEVSSEKAYRARYQNPVLPGGESGVTIGIGYDLGYATPASLKRDWSGILAAATFDLLTPACGLRGKNAIPALDACRAATVSWDQAYDQFSRVLLPLYVALTLSALPNAKGLSNKSLGALVSLTFNRGAAYSLPDARFEEMRNIAALLRNGKTAEIPAEIRNMKHIWANKPGLEGLLLRRDMEAALFEEGLKRI